MACAASLLFTRVYLGLEFFVRLYGRRREEHAARDIVALDAAEERPRCRRS